jgi:hypothetical protein
VASSAEHSWWDSQRLTPPMPHVGTARGAWVSACARAVTARFAAELVGRMKWCPRGDASASQGLTISLLGRVRARVAA